MYSTLEKVPAEEIRKHVGEKKTSLSCSTEYWEICFKVFQLIFHYFDKINFHLVELNGKFFMNEVYLTWFLYIHVKDLKDWWWKVWEQFLWGRSAIWKSLGKVRRQMGMERNEEKMITFWDRAAQDMMITFWDKAGPNRQGGW